MSNLFNPSTGEFNVVAFHKGKGAPTATYDVGGYQIDSDKASSFLIGWVAGMQYQLDTLGPCFTTTVATLDSFDYLKSDWTEFITNYQYYNLIVYDPIHIYQNILATYE